MGDLTLTEETLETLVHNPNLIQQYILSDIANTGTNRSLTNNSTPFSMLIEAASVVSSALRQETFNAIRSKFPILASTKDDLFQHLTDNEIINIFSKPAEGLFRINILTLSLVDGGYTSTGSNYIEAIIPIGSTITFKGMVFTFLNDVLIKFNNITKTPYASILPSSNPLAYTDKGDLKATITSDSVGNSYISFEVPLKQLSIKTATIDSDIEGGASTSINLDNKYCYSEVYSKITEAKENEKTSIKTVKIPQVYSSDYLDPSNPQVYVSIGDNAAKFNISRLYTENGSAKAPFVIYLYETKGELFYPMDNYNADEFKLSLPKIITSTDPRASVPSRLKLVTKGVGNIYGGSNALDLDALKSSLINNTTGPIDKPVTQYHIDALAKESGYTISLAEDTLTHRLYTAFKPLPDVKSTSIKALPDVFLNTVKFTLEELKSIYPNAIKADVSVIRSNTVFREDNGVMSLVSPDDLKSVQGMAPASRNNYFRENKHFYNPFTVVIDNDNGYTDSRIYHLDNPKVNSFRVISKNLNISDISVNVNAYYIERTDKGYRLYVSYSGDSGYSDINIGYRKVQATVKLNNGECNYFGTYDSNYGHWVFDINIDDFINSDDMLSITNSDKQGVECLMPLVTDIELYFFITDRSKYDEFAYLQDKIALPENQKINIVSVLTEDRLNITFGMKLDYIWNKFYNSFDTRRYKRYEEDIYLTYEQDVLAKDADGKIMFEINPDGSKIEVKKLHEKGEFVLDAEGNKIIKHKKGSVILNSDGDPIVDAIPDIVRFIDIVMLEYEFKLSDETSYKRLMELMISYFENMLIGELPTINNNLLEKTSILYKPNKSTAPVRIMADNSKSTVPYIVTPKVTIYIPKTTSVTLTDIEIYKQKIGDIFIKHLKNKTIVVNDIKEDIKSTLDMTINAVKIENLSPYESEIIEVLDINNQLTIDKILTYTEYKTNVVNYNIDLNFIRL